MQRFFNKHYILFYILLFFLIGLNIYALLWKPICENIMVPNIPISNNIPPEQNSIINCNEEVQSGGQGQTTTTHSLGNQAGTVEVVYNMKSVPDRMDIYINGSIVASTNQDVSGTGSLNFNVPQNNNINYCEVVVSAPYEGTEWGYKINCPR